MNYLRVTSGAEAMSLLLTSERVFTDFHDWSPFILIALCFICLLFVCRLRYGEPDQLVLRRFEPEVTLDHEFRAYVSKGKVTAISQYDKFCQ